MSDETIENEEAARELATVPPITAEDMETIRKAVGAGLIPGSEFLTAADIEADTPITIRPPVDLEDIRLARESYARGEGIDVGGVLREMGVEFKEK